MPRLCDFRGVHYGEVIVVCGLGASLNSLRDPRRFRTIGVNDIGRAFTPDYLFVMDSPKSFGERFEFVRNSQARYVFTDHDLGLPRDNVVKFPIRQSAAPRFNDPHALYLIGRPPTSPFLALCLAAHMGAKAIGLIGVDFTNGHFFADDGVHKLAPQLAGINRRFFVLGNALLERGVKIFNLSAESRINAFPRMGLEEFYALQQSGGTRSWSRPAKRLCFHSSAPVDENTVNVARLINAHTMLSCRVVAPASPDIRAASVPEIEREVFATAAVRLDCGAVRLPEVPYDRQDFLRAWNDSLRPLLFRPSRDLPARAKARPLSVSVIVSQDNATGDELAETVRTLRPDLRDSDELIVLGRSRAHGTFPAWLRNSRRMRFVEQQPGQTFVSLRNAVGVASDRDILVFTDANVQAPPVWVDPLLHTFKNRTVAAAGPALADMYERESKGYGMKWTDAELNTAWLSKQEEEPYAVPLLAGAFLAVRGAVFRRLGGFDAGMLDGGADDVELCLRLWTAGLQCVIAPGLEISWMNPFAAGAVGPGDYWGALVYNLLRLATIHFGPTRIRSFVRQVAKDPVFPPACARLLVSDAAERRKALVESRRHTAGWFFQRFAGL
jgi:GT2 family glycosyltransferase